MAVLESSPHALTVRTGSEPWGCSNRVWAEGYYAPQRSYRLGGIFDTVLKFIPHTMSKECRQSGTTNDPRCEGCQERGMGDEYVERIRRNGT
jgi:hypothetical protein